MKKLTVVLISVACMILEIACGNKTEVVKQESKTEVQEEVKKEEVKKEEIDSTQKNTINKEKEDTSKETMMNTSQIEKSIMLVDKVFEDKQSNIMLSPLSLNMALGLLQDGVIKESDSDKALTSYLGENYSTFAEDYINNKLPEFNSEVEYSDYKTAFEIANSIWIDDKYEINDDYKENTNKTYNAEVGTIDKGDIQKSTQVINDWCSDKTHQLIPSIVSEDAIRNATSVLINSVYFESAWTDEWFLLDETFTNLDGSTVDKELLRNNLGTYYENDKAIGFSAGYMNGMEFIGILPKENGDFNLQDLDIPSLLESKTYEYDVRAMMPELDFSTDVELGETLASEFGLSPIFKADTVDFSNTICNSDLYVSEIIQKTKLELDQYGTKAAAVTAVMMETCGIELEVPEEKEVFLNRPFAFMIYDSVSDVPVFIGKVVNIE